jgi:hypothetical protein
MWSCCGLLSCTTVPVPPPVPPPVQLYKEYVDPEFTWSNFSVEEQAKVSGGWQGGAGACCDAVMALLLTGKHEVGSRHVDGVGICVLLCRLSPSLLSALCILSVLSPPPHTLPPHLSPPASRSLSPPAPTTCLTPSASAGSSPSCWASGSR